MCHLDFSCYVKWRVKIYYVWATSYFSDTHSVTLATFRIFCAALCLASLLPRAPCNLAAHIECIRLETNEMLCYTSISSLNLSCAVRFLVDTICSTSSPLLPFGQFLIHSTRMKYTVGVKSKSLLSLTDKSFRSTAMRKSRFQPIWKSCCMCFHYECESSVYERQIYKSP